ncbi:OmpH family outer membrane protein [Geofilum sp. OHC36d9]|uniref:OmpH family outer membrane protein n=1 Tax=Geofilum sp. OHC36d9 TaxID=3458413 RepID=UPI004034F623
MKNLSLIVNVVLVIAVTALFIIVFSDGRADDNGQVNVDSAEDASAQLVFINTDSLLLKYEYARVLSEKLISKEEASRTDLNERVKIFQQDMNEFQRKLQNNGFLSLERAQSEESRLRKKEQELQELNSRFSNELMVEQDKMNRELRDTITSFLSTYCQERSYQMVLSNTMGDNLLYADESLDVTNEVAEKLNARYKVVDK